MVAFRWWAFQVVAALLVMGCGEGGREESVTALGANLNGANLNGANLNGANLNGANLNGPGLEGLLESVDFAGARRGAGVRERALDALWLEGSQLQASEGGQVLSGADLLGARLVGNLGSGGKVALRVEAVQRGQGADADVWTYYVSYQDTHSGEWLPICRTGKGSPEAAIAVAGRWDYRQGVSGGGAKREDAAVFTFACEGAAIAKCVRFGYKPWATVRGVSLAGHHQACTRLVRADYCGDGASHTVDGQWVNLHDAAGVQADTERWMPEAEWDEDGARCLTGYTRSRGEVACGEGRQRALCGSPWAFRDGALLVSELPGRGGRGSSEGR